MPEVVLYVAILLSGLSAGLFVGWSVSVIPGTRRTGDTAYIETMQRINVAIVNPLFLVIFLGTAIALVLSSIALFVDGQSRPGWFVTASASTYLLGMLAVTVAGNIPLNNALDRFDLARSDAGNRADRRSSYERSWNRLHYIRSAAGLLAFALALAGAW